MKGYWEEEAAALKEARRRLAKELEGAGAPERERGMRESVTDLSFAANHPADLGTENFERSKELSLKEHSCDKLHLIDEALARMEQGTYGSCLRCGEEIARDRLKAAPEAPFCLPCEEYVERPGGDPHRRPVEEELLEPPFERSTVPGDPGFGSEDIWEEVAQYNRRPRIYEESAEGEAEELVEETDALTNEDFREQTPD